MNGYLAKTGKSFGLHVEPERWTGLVVPFVVASVWWTVSRVRRRIHSE